MTVHHFDPRKHLLLTGRPGSGKTTIIRNAVKGRENVGGFWTGEIRRQGKRTGFKITTLDGLEGVLAAVGLKSPASVSRYGVNIEDIERLAVTSIESAAADPAIRVIVIDEIASMELASDAFRLALASVFDTGKRVLASIQMRADPLLEEIRARPDVSLVTVRADNRDDLPAAVAKWLDLQPVE